MGKNNKPKSRSKKINELDQKVEKLIKEYNTLLYNSNAIDKLNKINNEITNIGFHITYNKLSVTESKVEEYNLLKKDKIKTERIVKSEKDRLEQLRRELDTIGDNRITLLVENKELEDIEKKIHYMYGIDEKFNKERSNNPIIRRVTSEIESKINDINVYKPKLNRKDIARCIGIKYSLYKELLNKELIEIKVTKKDYFEAICIHIEVVNKNSWTAIDLYNDYFR